jgi:hypothetical protein
VRSLFTDTAEEVTQEAVRIIKNSKPPRDNLTRTERWALKSLHMDADLTVLPADKGNATVILNTIGYVQKINALLEDSTYRKLAKDPTESVERKIALLLKKSKLAEDICKRLRPPVQDLQSSTDYQRSITKESP